MSMEREGHNGAICSVGKTAKAKAARFMVKKMKELARLENVKQHHLSDEELKQQYMDCIRKLGWKPKTWFLKAVENKYGDTPLHEILSSDEEVMAVPHSNFAKTSLEWVRVGRGPTQTLYSAVRLETPGQDSHHSVP
ncbi:MAG: hypothetical protein QXF45_07995 [Candidatus Caldarchaeum sp.]